MKSRIGARVVSTESDFPAMIPIGSSKMTEIKAAIPVREIVDIVASQRPKLNIIARPRNENTPKLFLIKRPITKLIRIPKDGMPRVSKPRLNVNVGGISKTLSRNFVMDCRVLEKGLKNQLKESATHSTPTSNQFARGMVALTPELLTISKNLGVSSAARVLLQGRRNITKAAKRKTIVNPEGRPKWQLVFISNIPSPLLC
jgi:hypothetical protein